MIASLLLSASLAALALTQPSQTLTIFRATPDMTTGNILNACLGFAQEASADGSDLYRPLHSQYRFCLEDLREVAASDTREEIGDALAGLLEDADPVIEFHTILELGRLNYRGATSHIVEALQSDDWRVVVSAARVLGAEPLQCQHDM